MTRMGAGEERQGRGRGAYIEGEDDSQGEADNEWTPEVPFPVRHDTSRSTHQHIQSREMRRVDQLTEGARCFHRI